MLTSLEWEVFATTIISFLGGHLPFFRKSRHSWWQVFRAGFSSNRCWGECWNVFYSCSKVLVKKVVAIERSQGSECCETIVILMDWPRRTLMFCLLRALPIAQTIVPLFLADDQPGRSCHQLARNQGFNLKPLNISRKSISVYAVSLASVVRNVLTSGERTIHIKIDVDGIEKMFATLFLKSASFQKSHPFR